MAIAARIGRDVGRLQAVLDAVHAGRERRLHERRRALRFHRSEIGVGRGHELGAGVPLGRWNGRREQCRQPREVLRREPTLFARPDDDRLDLGYASSNDCEAHEQLRDAAVLVERRQYSRAARLRIERIVSIRVRRARAAPEPFAERGRAAVLRVRDACGHIESRGVVRRER